MAWKILLADDSVTAQNMGRKILTDAGYEVVTVNNGSAALKRVAEIKPDLIILDVYMPGYSGLEVCQRLKDAAETASIPVLLTVGKLEPFKADEGRRVGADHHIVKPFEASELLTAITHLEDRIVSQHSANPARSSDRSNKLPEDAPQAETGWAGRLTFSSKKKKEEKESAPEDAGAAAGFRDFRKAKGKPVATGSVTLKPPPALGQEPGLVPVVERNAANHLPSNVPIDVARAGTHDVSQTPPPQQFSNSLPDRVPIDIPSDITTDELDALSAFASKLGPPAAAPAGFAAAETAAGEEFGESAAESNETKTPAPASRGILAAADAPAFPEFPAFAVEGAVEGKSEVEIPVEYAETALDEAVSGSAAPIGAVSVSAVPVSESGGQPDDREVSHSEITGPNPQLSEPTLAAASTAGAEEAAPANDPVDRVDKNDEPLFAVSAIGGQAAEAVVQGSQGENEVERLGQAKDMDNAAAEISVPGGAVAAAPETGQAAGPDVYAENLREVGGVPSDAELVEALRLLTPATSESGSVPSSDRLVAAGQLLAEEAMRSAAAAPRWVAEPVALSPEEMAVSLEAEMLGTLATHPAPTPVDGNSRGITGVSAITAAVESRLAESGLAGNGFRNEPDPDGEASEARPKAMAAAAAESSAITGSPDARIIASIVDSVIADLRPKIAEEIARKLAGK